MFSITIDPKYIHYDGKTQLHLACRDGNFELANELIKLGVDINKQDKDGATALYISKKNEIVKLLIEAGADPDLQNYRSCYTPLLDAMVWWNETKYNLLVPLTDLNIKCSFGYTALMFSAIYHRLDDIKFLISAGADLYIRNYEGMDFYDFLFEDEKEYIHTQLPEFLSKRQLLLDDCSIKALSRRIQ
jgi:ankyrin repeat protein